MTESDPPLALFQVSHMLVPDERAVEVRIVVRRREPSTADYEHCVPILPDEISEITCTVDGSPNGYTVLDVARTARLRVQVPKPSTEIQIVFRAHLRAFFDEIDTRGTVTSFAFADTYTSGSDADLLMVQFDFADMKLFFSTFRPEEFGLDRGVCSWPRRSFSRTDKLRLRLRGTWQPRSR